MTLRISVLCLAFTCCGLSGTTAAQAPSANHQIDVTCWRLYQLVTRSHQADKAAESQLADLVRSENDPVVLRATALWALRRARTHGCDGVCNICERYDLVFDNCIETLAKMKSESSLQQLIFILTDRTIRGNAHGTELLYEAIRAKGKSALPLLAPLRKANSIARDLYADISRTK